jgi:hypothetical protein
MDPLHQSIVASRSKAQSDPGLESSSQTPPCKSVTSGRLREERGTAGIHKYHFSTEVVTDLQPSNGSQLNNDDICFDGIYIVKNSNIKLSINKANYLFLNAGMIWFYHQATAKHI